MRLPKFLRKENPAYRSIFATTGATGPAWKTADYSAYIREGYLKCVTVYSCVSLIAKNSSRIGWTLKSKQDELDEHPLLTLLGRPNERESGARFTEKTLAFYQLAGNSYTLKVQGLPSNPPRYLYSMRPDRMTIEKSGDWKNPVGRYKYSVSGSSPEYFKPEDVLHVTEFHPLDDWYGLSKIEVLARRVDISNEIAAWNKKIFESEMRIPGIVTGKTMFDLDKLRDRWIERYHAADAEKGVPVFLEGEDIKFTPITASPKDIDWIGGSKLVMREICSTLGVPSMLLGDTEATTYANYQEARRALYQETILPLMDLLRDEYNAWLVPLYGDRLYLDYDRDGIEALQEEREKKYAYLANAGWLSLNEKRVATGYDEITEGDVILVPISNVPLEEATAPPEPMPDMTPNDPNADDEPDADEPPPAKSARRAIKAVKKSFWTDPERKSALWTNFEKRARTREKSFLELAKGYMKGQGERITEKVRAFPSIAGITPAALLDKQAETDLYVTRFKPWYHDAFIRAGNAGIRASKGELFDDGELKADAPTSWVFHMTPAQEAKLRSHIFNTGSEVNDTTIDKIYAQLKDAQAANMTVDEFARTLGDKLDELSRSRARLWASNESVWTDSYGQNEAFKQTEFVDMKGWLSAMLPTSREDHMAASGQEVGVNESFKIGSYMQEFPGDGSQGAPVEETIQCKCSIYPVVGGGA